MIEYLADKLLIKYCPSNGSILELGNQIMDLENVQGISAKKYYSDKGYQHTSIDINGKDGALKLDLSKPIKENLGTFDLVMDAGTTEHVSDLYECLANVFKFAGNIIIHKNPRTGSFNDGYHEGAHHFTIHFWREYANLTNLEILELFEYPIYHNIVDGWEVVAVIKKKEESKMITKKEFEEKLSNYVFTR